MNISAISCGVAAVLLAGAMPAFAQQRPNVSDVTGPNVSDVTGPNVSDVTGPNVSDVTGVNNDRIRRANLLGFDESGVEQLADELGAAYDACASGGDCAPFFTLLEQSNEILGE